MDQEKDESEDDVIETDVTCIVLDNGAGIPLCSIEHLSHFAVSVKKLGPVRIGQTKAQAAYCTHCYWCGAIIRRPKECVVHTDERCPGWIWVRTEFAREVYYEFHRIYQRPPTEDEIRMIRFNARAKPELTTRELVRRVKYDPDS
jgi:hypothetical protein